MMRPWRLLALTVVLCATVHPAVATAQTVIVRNAPSGATVEVALNGTVLETAPATPVGEARIETNLFTGSSASETSAQILIDTCGVTRRVGFVERRLEPPAAPPGCERHSLAGFFVLRPVTTVVIDLGPATPTVLTRQGPAPPNWLGQPGSGRRLIITPPALSLFGGASFVHFRDSWFRSCGRVSPCTGKDFRPSLTGGASFWFTPYTGAEVSFIRAAKLDVEGEGDNFTFTSVLDADLLTIAGNIGGSVSRVRFYGQGGVNYHEGTTTVMQTVDDRIVTVDGVEQTIQGGSQTLATRTGGWGWLFGGGLEIWLTRPVGLWFDTGVARYKGTDLDGGETRVEDRITYARIGARIRLGP